MPDWVLWMIAAGVLAVGEIVSLSFFMGPVAVAAIAAAIAAAVGGGLAVQIVVFIVTSIASIGVLRPIARRHLKTPSQLRTGTQALVGRQAEVLERVDRRGGQIKLAGEVWTARSYDEDDVLEAGTQAHVMKIDGATALVVEA
ncbi:MAG TPA: NfeD family protein [Thermoleophilaceae bacterium]|nr:NfeD family protein [Thermoleophilaceae bacterium]